MLEIVQLGDPVLRKEAKVLPVKEISTKRIKELLSQIKGALRNEPHGAGLAAPQLGIPLRIFVVSGQVLSDTVGDTEEKKVKDLVCINPKMLKSSKKTAEVDEGCLSIRGKYGKVPRAEKVTLRAYDERGRLFERGASGLLAQVFQHELDHLNGKLFIDRATEIWEVDEAQQQHGKTQR